MKTLVVCLFAAMTGVMPPPAAIAQTQPTPAPSSPPPARPAQAKPAAPSTPSQAEMAAVMERAKKYTQPGPSHQLLERFAGKWTTETQFFMAGKPTPAEKGAAEFSWQLPGRWMKAESTGAFLGRPARSFSLLGYDNFRHSYVMMAVSTMDTAMSHAEGDMDPEGKALILYGPQDEYLTGEIAKLVKYVWRFESKDAMVFEVHDLPIGESNTKVLQVRYTRQP